MFALSTLHLRRSEELSVYCMRESFSVRHCAILDRPIFQQFVLLCVFSQGHVHYSCPCVTSNTAQTDRGHLCPGDDILPSRKFDKRGRISHERERERERDSRFPNVTRLGVLGVCAQLQSYILILLGLFNEPVH